MPSTFNNEELLYHQIGNLQMRIDHVSEFKIIRGWADRSTAESTDAWLLEQTIIENGIVKEITYSDPLGKFNVSWDDRLIIFPDAGSGAGVGFTNFFMAPFRLFDEEGKAYSPGNPLPTNALSSGLSTALEVTTLSVGDTATLIPTTAQTDRNTLAIHNTDGANTVYLGNSDVTADTVVGTTSGWELTPNSVLNFTITDSIVIYGRCTGGNSALVKVMELS